MFETPKRQVWMLLATLLTRPIACVGRLLVLDVPCLATSVFPQNHFWPARTGGRVLRFCKMTVRPEAAASRLRKGVRNRLWTIW